MSVLRRIFLSEWTVAWVIIANSVLLFMMGFDQFHSTRILDRIDHFFTIFFMLEIAVKVREMSWKNYIADSGNKFDFFLVAISVPSLFELFITIPDISYLLAFRLLRVIRILRFLRFIPNLKKMLEGIRRAFKASVFVILALFIYNILLAILSNYLFKHEAPEYFNNPLLSLYSIFQLFTLEGWTEIPNAILENAGPDSWKSSFARIYFLVIVLSGGIFGFSMVNAIFVDEMTMDNNDALEAKVDELNTKLDQLLAERGEK